VDQVVGDVDSLPHPDEAGGVGDVADPQLNAQPL
jgi:hypothetical protein